MLSSSPSALSIPSVSHEVAFCGLFSLNGALSAVAVNYFCVLSFSSVIFSIFAVAATVVAQTVMLSYYQQVTN